MNTIINNKKNENFDLALTDSEILGYYFKNAFDGQTVGDLNNELASYTRSVLHIAVVAGNSKKSGHAMQAALVLSIILENLISLDPKREINSFDSTELGEALRNLELYFSGDLTTWCSNAITFYNCLVANDCGICFEEIEQTITIIRKFDYVIKEACNSQLNLATCKKKFSDLTEQLPTAA